MHRLDSEKRVQIIYKYKSKTIKDLNIKNQKLNFYHPLSPAIIKTFDWSAILKIAPKMTTLQVCSINS